MFFLSCFFFPTKIDRKQNQNIDWSLKNTPQRDLMQTKTVALISFKVSSRLWCKVKIFVDD